MKVDVVYTCVPANPTSLCLATRFVATNANFPGGADHRTIAMFNGSEMSQPLGMLFSSIDAITFTRSNDGWDIGGYIEAARGICADSDLMVCLGESVHFHKPGWLSKIIQAFSNYGPGMYGMLSSFVVRPHLQTTAFCITPNLLAKYPRRVMSKADRYYFEHGENCFANWLKFQRFPVKLVTFDGIYDEPMWRIPKNILWKGDQSNCLVWCNHTDNYTKATPKIRDFWQRAADSR